MLCTWKKYNLSGKFNVLSAFSDFEIKLPEVSIYFFLHPLRIDTTHHIAILGTIQTVVGFLDVRV